MKPNSTNLTTTISHGTDNDERVRASIDNDAIAFILGTLTDMYSDPALAVLREYSCNARDSHVEAGNPEPIQITLPTRLVPSFVVQDYGVGLSHDELIDSFSKYGTSTKREDDEVVGMIGIGSKSGWTFTNQFTIIAVKNGVKTTVLATRDPDSVGALDVMDTCATEERNGVRIEIPVGDIYDFNETAANFFRFWPEGTVLVDGEIPECIFDSHLSLDPDIAIVKDADLYNDVIVMGNVPYVSPTPLSTRLQAGYHVVARVDIGAVSFAPNREQLQLTRRTKEVIASVIEFVDDGIQRYVHSVIDQAPTRRDALRSYVEWRDAVKINLPKWQGELLPSNAVKVSAYRCTSLRSNYRGQKRGSNVSELGIERIIDDEALFVVGHPKRAFNVEGREVINEWGDGNWSEAWALHDIKPSDLVWLEGAAVVEWDVLSPPKERAERASRGKSAPAPKFAEYQGGGLFSEAEVDPSRDVVYLFRTDRYGHGGTTREHYRRDVASYLQRASITTPQILLVGKNGVEKLLKLRPDARNVAEHLQYSLELAESALTDDVRAWDGASQPFAGHKPSAFRDPKIAALAQRFTAITKLERDVEVWQRLRDHAAEYIIDDMELKSTLAAPKSDLYKAFRGWAKKYPLISEHVSRLNNDQVEYINALYAFRNPTTPAPAATQETAA